MMNDESTALIHHSAPPWHLMGAAILLPLGLRRALSLVHYTTSPVGPYDELALSVLTLHGPSVVDMPVTSAASMRGGRANWGYPKRLAHLRWDQQGERVVFRAGRRVWRVRLWGPSWPVSLRLWTIQTRNGHWVRVPLHARGRVRLAFRGHHWALFIESLELVVWPPVAVQHST